MRLKVPCPVVLASSSPERRRLLATLVERFEVVEPLVDESGLTAGSPEEVVCARACAKAEEVAARRAGALVVAADTVAECCGRLIGKPRDLAHAAGILAMLGEHPHRVITGVCVIAPDGRRVECVSVARLRMRRLGREEIDDYVRHHDVLGRAGGYAIEEDDPNVQSLEGSRSAVMGLPVEELEAIMQSIFPDNGLRP